MDRKKLRAVKSAAIEVRDWAEENHHEYGHDKDLCGMCAIASARLFNALADKGINSTIILNTESPYGCHVYLIVDGYVVDVTATQFPDHPYDPVVIIDRAEAEEYGWWQGGKEIDCPKALLETQTANNWPSNQLAVV